ncbi:phosphoglycerate kinase [Candidatus Falkowbacteria bacterium RIFOXYB2_FULL_34_18]|uniref:Phosphoglycerate kinase n=1 Tax=Candidatus Falkowbacteria bacterium RIFOXYD2_FULL_34_120 TaxID=1798007 RepID=A0A1F5TSH1_9BACT|nr:MAG: phosphoglycerate kinase [Candidatus Falkowbacteria bacterium RIFOXYB2_FULL_34_18]OGF30195.1 MAG: phosphoglycerate kinase [Candidatus Falkowbacteria bacterium RIFOXYC12_FULL_34_55]OGF37656.1 MAG: phosphoglycerate kinase [Candidatus Falkowbacteria bacterium RIFOXYC2_FULL_34_220]OGF39383.1 MAG: phosphoglycerate kinase [Candidatus Falkowbacteria bacterium RIFOXYD12_FULL_34_57]OGF41912.1 MAG: phosphoglycerate kinase [Candidatus Falkowbacteria bacterium RIFOXYD2_FULL_34_120]
MKVKSIKQAKNIEGKRVVLRVDFNVPIKNGVVLNDYKIKRQLPTIEFLLEKKCKIILITHLGRPEGKFKKDLSIRPVIDILEEELCRDIKIIKNISGFEGGSVASYMKNGDIVAFENIRFEPGEEKNSKNLAKNLAKLGDVYVNDAFGVSHRAHASLSAIQKYLPAFAGLLLEKEVLNLSKVFDAKKPFVLVIGGNKIKTKVPLIKAFYRKADKILVGGALANNFFRIHDFEIGKSLTDKESLKFAQKFKNKKIVLPVDVVISAVKGAKNPVAKDLININKGDYIYDIGPKTIKLFSDIIKKANTIIWNGPMGLFEENGFHHGTMAMANVIAGRSRGKAFGVVGGGETIEALQKTKMIDAVDWASTGGGASLAFLGKKKMPGLRKIVTR